MAQRKCLVIDTSIARSAGTNTADHGRSGNCRQFLASVLEICHRVAVTVEITEEWRRHRSRYFRLWYRRMLARKKVVPLPAVPTESLRSRIEALDVPAKVAGAMLKDVHLLEAALRADCIVASCDETVREHFAAASVVLKELRGITWVNPERDELSSWLAAGARSRKTWQLGAATELLR